MFFGCLFYKIGKVCIWSLVNSCECVRCCRIVYVSDMLLRLAMSP